MIRDPATFVIAILAIGAASQWLALRLRVPSILALLVTGFALGQTGVGVLDPDAVLSASQLSAVISLAVAVILFEGGLTLKLDELRDIGRPVLALITVGALIAFAATAALAAPLLGLSWPVAAVLGAVLVVTGPTVVGPLLQHIRPRGRGAAILRWEGILNDPIGVMLAVVVFECVIAINDGGSVTRAIAGNLARTLGLGLGAGALGGLLLSEGLRRHWIPEKLQGFFCLAAALVTYAGTNAIQHESGLLAVTALGIALVSRRGVPIKPILEFKENLGVMLISSLFLLLTARVQLDVLERLELRHALFVAALVLVVRPASVFGSLAWLRWPVRESLFIAWLAPRGIVAVALTSLFAIDLQARGFPSAELLEPVVFLVVALTVALYGLTAGPLARSLGLAESEPQGLLIMGAHPWARELARSVTAAGYRALLLDTNEAQVSQARAEGLEAAHGDLLSPAVHDNLDLAGIGRFLALTPNDEANSLAAVLLSETFGRKEVYQLCPASADGAGPSAFPPHLRGRLLFGPGLTYHDIARAVERGASIGLVPAEPSERERPFLSIGPRGLVPVTCESRPQPGAAIGLRLPDDAPPPPAQLSAARRASSPSGMGRPLSRHSTAL